MATAVVLVVLYLLLKAFPYKRRGRDPRYPGIHY